MKGREKNEKWQYDYAIDFSQEKKEEYYNNKLCEIVTRNVIIGDQESFDKKYEKISDQKRGAFKILKFKPNPDNTAELVSSR